MKRIVHVVAAMAALAGVACVATPQAQAGPVIQHIYSGTLTDTYSGKPIRNATIEATPVAGAPLTTTTDLSGNFSFTSPEATLGFKVLSALNHQAGFRNCDIGTTISDIGPACQLGYADPILLNTMPDYVAGQVIDSITLLPIAGVTVKAVGTDGVTPFGTGLTDATGRYVVHGVVGEEVGIFVNGLAVGHRAGYFSCLKTLVRTWGEACTYTAGFRMTHVIAPLLSVPRNVVLAGGLSLVKVSLVQPLFGMANGYDLRCVSPNNTMNVVHFLATTAKVGPFPAGLNKCSVRATSVWGPGPYAQSSMVMVL